MKVFRVSFSTFFGEPSMSFLGSFYPFLGMPCISLDRKYLEVSAKNTDARFGLVDFENKSIW